MKVYVMTKAKPFGDEIFVDVKATRKAAEKAFREQYPFMRHSMGDAYASHKNISDIGAWLLFIHGREV